MKKSQGKLIFSATDLSNFINCKHLTQLNKLAAEGVIKKPIRNNKVLEMLQQKGLAFEQAYLGQLSAEGKSIAYIVQDDPDAKQKTLEAMQNGLDVVYQARLEENNWHGWADFLIRVEQPSKLGSWSYAVLDTKLATTTKSGTILQIALYSQIIANIQGKLPEFMYVQTPDEQLQYRVDDYIAYVRYVKTNFLESVQKSQQTYPEPVQHCEVCNWWENCNKIRRDDDHLGFIAGMGNSQIKEVRTHDVNTLEAMSEMPLPINFKPSRGSVITYTKLREQARLQNESRTQKRPVYETLPLIPGAGFFKLPEPNEWDVYLDLEGDPLVDPSGREYIFGWYHQDKYNILWAENADLEKLAFEKFIDVVLSIIAEHPEMHVYHYGAYETSTFKRLMSKYATREIEVDYLLKTFRFVNLHTIVKNAIRAGVERYSLKDLEKYHGYVREMDLRQLSGFKADYELLLETNRIAEATDEMRDVIQTYNMDDCISTQKLHFWLEGIRQFLIDSGETIERPLPADPETPEITEYMKIIQPLYNALMEGIPAEKKDRNSVQQANFIIANMLAWFRREKKSYWWELFRILDLVDDEFIEEKIAIGGLNYMYEREDVKRSIVDHYSFPMQVSDIRKGDKVKDDLGRMVGEVYEVDYINCILKLKKGPSIADVHPSNIFFLSDVPADVKEVSIINFAIWILENGVDSPSLQYKAGRDLLLRKNPETFSPVIQTNDTLEKAIDWAEKLNYSVLPIQGPPGAGKSYTASHMILELVKQKKRIGIAALSHKVITALVEKVYELSFNEGHQLKIIQRDDRTESRWQIARETKALANKVEKYDVIAGTPFMWASGDFKDSIDYLFVDEAGQLALVDTLSMSHATKNMILLGDPQQLQQPQQGIHPDGTEVSSLEHVLGGQKTITNAQGLFLPVTFRMHPKICNLVSELFYEQKLQSLPGLQNQCLKGNTRFAGSGLFFESVMHNGNTNFSIEEVDAVEHIVKELCKGDVMYCNKNLELQTVTASHIKIITPYNAQLQALKDRLPDISIGTVDKFQGQEAPIIIFSMATSASEDAPHGMSFLYSPNRFNVAISRAKSTFILVANKHVIEAECKSPEQMKLANAFCRYMEMVV
jgi:predicted RecB family nuclease